MTSSASDILSVIFLQKEANIKSKLRVVPLFETLDDLINGKKLSNKYVTVFFKVLKNKDNKKLNISFVTKKKLEMQLKEIKLKEG